MLQLAEHEEDGLDGAGNLLRRRLLARHRPDVVADTVEVPAHPAIFERCHERVANAAFAQGMVLDVVARHAGAPPEFQDRTSGLLELTPEVFPGAFGIGVEGRCAPELRSINGPVSADGDGQETPGQLAL